MSAIFQTLDPNLFPINRGQCWMSFPGSSTEQNIGSVIVAFTPKVERAEIKTNEDPLRPIVARPTVDLQGEVKVTFSQWSRAATALAFMAPNGEFFTQQALVSRTQSFVGVMDGDVLPLTDAEGKSVKNVVVSSVEVGGVALGPSSYRVDPPTGLVQITDASILVDDVDVEFSAPAIANTDKKAMYRFLQARDIVVSLRIRQNNLMGDDYDIFIPKISLSASGEVKLISDSNDPEKIEADGLILYDNTQPPGKERGFAVKI